MNEATGGILNTTLTAKYVCEGCGGVLVEKNKDGDFVVSCAAGCDAGFLTKRKYDARKSKQLGDYMEAAANYPELISDKSTPEKRKKELASMF